MSRNYILLLRLSSNSVWDGLVRLWPWIIGLMSIVGHGKRREGGKDTGLFILKKKIITPYKNHDLILVLPFLCLFLSLSHLYNVTQREAWRLQTERSRERERERQTDDIVAHVLVLYLSMASATNTNRHTFVRTHSHSHTLIPRTHHYAKKVALLSSNSSRWGDQGKRGGGLERDTIGKERRDTREKSHSIVCSMDSSSLCSRTGTASTHRESKKTSKAADLGVSYMILFLAMHRVSHCQTATPKPTYRGVSCPSTCDLDAISVNEATEK